MSREGKRKPGAGRKRGALKRASLPDLAQTARLNATRYGATGLQAFLLEMLLSERNRGTTELLLASPDTAPIVASRREFLAAWLADASAADLCDLAAWVEGNPPGVPPTPVDPIADALLRLPQTMFAIQDKEGRIRRWKATHGPDGRPCGTGEWVDVQGRAIDFDMLAPGAHPVGFADPYRLLAGLRDREICAFLKDFCGMKNESPDAIRKALKSLGVPRPPRQRNADGTFD